MCGIFGIVSHKKIDSKSLKALAKHARQRGRDSSGLITHSTDGYKTSRADFDINQLLGNVSIGNVSLCLGHSRLITNGSADNQPVMRDDVIAIHNGIVVNDDEIWDDLTVERKFKIDSEIIIGIALEHLKKNNNLSSIPTKIFEKCKGVVACALLFPKLGKMLLFSNNGSLYTGTKDGSLLFSSESYPLIKLGCLKVTQVKGDAFIYDIPKEETMGTVKDHVINRLELVAPLSFNKEKEALLEFNEPKLKRCTKCILPETMPFITFSNEGICNYCTTYTPKNRPKPKEELFKLVEPYRRSGETDCIVPFSGGRDSCYGLHLIVEELKMKPITYTYDWGLVTDLGRRNISRMCSQLGVENIIVAADLTKKRDNVARNLKAWMKSPHLGMMGILTAGDKHFFRHVETVK